MSNQLKLSFAGTPDLAASILQKLISSGSYRIECVYTQPDKPAGRGRKLNKSAVKELAESCQLAIKQPLRPDEIDPENDLTKVDILIVAAYGMLLPQAILDRPRLGCINVHTSLLPRWRGAAPIQRAIQTGDKETGISIMQMDSGLDTGQILLQKKCAINDDETAGSLHDKLALLGGETLLELLHNLATGPLQGRPQNDAEASYARKISKKEAEINWSLPADVIERTIRAFNPKPGASTVLNNRQLKIWDAEVPAKHSDNMLPGTVLACTSDGIDVATADRVIRIKKLQLPGKKVITAAAFHNGHPNFICGK